jgi:hypothetical protein
MKKLFLTVIAFSLCLLLPAQVYRAYLDELGATKVTRLTDAPAGIKNGQAITYNQLQGWPKKIAAHQNFKNMRGATIADIDGDGVSEILAASYNKLYAFKSNGDLLWSKSLTGTAIYPPTVADIDLDGNLEIAQATGGVPANGRIYLLDHNGSDLTGWPMNFSNHWILCSPVLADVDGDGPLEIIFTERIYPNGNLQIRKIDGSAMNPGWPVAITSTPATTPSVGDIDGDGNKEIVLCSYNDVLAFGTDGALKPGFPVVNPGTAFSYQSPLLVDLDGTGKLNIVGASHGDAPEFYTLKFDGSYRPGWPVAIPNNDWTYTTPAVVDIAGKGTYNLFFTKPNGDEVLPMLFGYNKNAAAISNFPVSARGGDEGIITVADVDNDGQYEVVTGSNLCEASFGFIHAFKMDGSGEVTGFPLRPLGFSYMNGADLADVNNDGILELISLSYEQNFSATDSAVLNVYSLNVPCMSNTILFGTYKGDNSRSGLITAPAPPVGFTLSGVVSYPNARQTPLEGINLVLKNSSGTVVGSATTDATGNYSFQELQNGEYTISPATFKTWGGVTASDVLLFKKHIANISYLQGIFLASGDVNGSGSLTASDVLLIKKRIASIVNSFPEGDWLFNSTPVTINGGNTILDFNGLCFGDANGSYIPAR